MELFYSAASPYARKTRVLVREFGVQLEEILVNTSDNDPSFISANPLGKVPVLVLDDGMSLFDSQVICSYLDTNFNDEKWLSKSWHDRVLAASIQGIMDESVTMIIEKRRPEELHFNYWLDRYRESIPRTLSWLWQQYKGLLTDGSEMHKISLACCLEYLNFRHGEISWQKQIPELADWLEMVSQRHSMIQTQPEL